MLVHYLPEQVSERWTLLRPILLETMPPEQRTPACAQNILRAILFEEAQLWGYELDGNVHLFILTTIYFDPVIQSKFLVVYGLYGVKAMPKQDWLAAVDTLKKFAVSKDCSGMTAYTSQINVVKISRKLGALANYVRLDWEV